MLQSGSAAMKYNHPSYMTSPYGKPFYHPYQGSHYELWKIPNSGKLKLNFFQFQVVRKFSIQHR